MSKNFKIFLTLAAVLLFAVGTIALVNAANQRTRTISTNQVPLAASDVGNTPITGDLEPAAPQVCYDNATFNGVNGLISTTIYAAWSADDFDLPDDCGGSPWALTQYVGELLDNGNGAQVSFYSDSGSGPAEQGNSPYLGPYADDGNSQVVGGAFGYNLRRYVFPLDIELDAGHWYASPQGTTSLAYFATSNGDTSEYGWLCWPDYGYACWTYMGNLGYPYTFAFNIDCDCSGPPPTGACCYEDGSCAEQMEEQACYDDGGTSWIQDEVCDPNPCPQPPVYGACCVPPGCCVDDLEQGYCEDVLGGEIFEDQTCEDIADQCYCS